MNRSKFLLASLVAGVTGAVRSNNEPSQGTRVLMYHDINHDNRVDDVYSLPYARFCQGVAMVAAWAKEMPHAFVSFSDTPTPGIAVTFDDGYRSTLRDAAPIFVEHRVPFHVFVTKAYVESRDPRYLTASQLLELLKVPGATLGLHGSTHSKFTQLTEDSLRRELHESRDWLQQLIGREVTSLSYPHGDFDLRVKSVVAECGFTTAACSNIGTFHDTAQALAIPRVDVWSFDSPQSTVAKTRGDWDALLP